MIEAEKNPHTVGEIDTLVSQGYVPISSRGDLENINFDETLIFGEGTRWEDEYPSGLDKKYIQVQDIDLSEGGDFEPIKTFEGGIYDGGGFTISNLTIKDPSKSRVGLFSDTTNSNIKNVGLLDVDVSGDNFVGGLVGYHIGGNIDNSYVTGTVQGHGAFAGGLVGRVISSDQREGRVTNSYSECTVRGVRSTGGLAGGQGGYYTQIIKSYSTGDIYGTGEGTGGLIGHSAGGRVYESFSSSKVEGVRKTGGLIGYLFGNVNSRIQSSYATGDVKGDIEVGGLIGHARGHLQYVYTTGNVTGRIYVGGLVGSIMSTQTSNAYSSGDVHGGRSEGQEIKHGIHSIGGLFGTVQSANTFNSYSVGSVTAEEGARNIGAINGSVNVGCLGYDTYYNKDQVGDLKDALGIGLSTEAMKKKDTFTKPHIQWNFDFIWEIKDGGYPTFQRWSNSVSS